jgi:hypothetical protein
MTLRMANDRKRHDVISLDEDEMRVGSSVVPITGLGNDRVLAIFVDTVRKQRHLTATAAIELRDEDLDVLASALDLSDRKLRARLTRIVGLSSAEAANVHHALLRRRAIAGAATLSLGAAGVFGLASMDAPQPVPPPSTALAPAFYATPWSPPTTAAVSTLTTPEMTWPAPSTSSASLASPDIGDAVTVWHAVGPSPEAAVPAYPSEPAPEIADPAAIAKDIPA